MRFFKYENLQTLVVISWLILCAGGFVTQIKHGNRPLAIVFLVVGLFVTLVLTFGWHKDEDDEK